MPHKQGDDEKCGKRVRVRLSATIIISLLHIQVSLQPITNAVSYKWHASVTILTPFCTYVVFKSQQPKIEPGSVNNYKRKGFLRSHSPDV